LHYHKRKDEIYDKATMELMLKEQIEKCFRSLQSSFSINNFFIAINVIVLNIVVINNFISVNSGDSGSA